MHLSKYINFIERRDGYAMFHSQLGEVCVVDKGIFKILQSFRKDNLEEINNITDVENIVEEFSKKGFLVDEDTDYLSKHTEERLKNLSLGHQVKTIQLIVSNNCNFKCKYCFENNIYSSEEREINKKDAQNKLMKSKDAIKYISQIIDMVKAGETASLHIQFFGGEPLINKDTIKAVLEHFQDGSGFQMNLSYSIVTNGSLIDDDIAEYFFQYNVAVIVSFDNPKKTDREMASGKDSIERTFEILNILKKHKNYMAFNSVLSDCTYDYFDTDIIDCAKEHNVKEVGIVLDLDPNFYKKRSTDQIANKILEVYFHGLRNSILVSGYWMSTYLSMFEHFESQKGFKTCSGTGSQFSIEPNGEVFACKGSSGYFGNLKNIPSLLNSENYISYAKRSVINSEKCKECRREGFCAGFCLGPLEKTYNDINFIVPEYCKLMNTLVDELINNEVKIDRYEL
jgi:uncharacterized protein